jgi:type I restriction enzyme, S subunit
MKQLSNENEIPKHWQRTTLGKILTISSGNVLTKSKRNDAGEYLVYGGNGVTGKHSEFLFEEEKLIIGRVGVHCGNAYITKPKSWVTDNAFVVSFDEKIMNKSFLLNLIGVLNLNKYSVSTAQPVISQGKLYPIEVAIPPLPEQQAIVAKIEELLSELDNGKQQLLTAQQQLKVYRQSLLKWAFEGKLTNKKVKDGELPKGWKFEELKNVCVIKRGKSKHRPRNEPALFGGKYPFIQTGDIREVNGGYIKKYTQTYSELGLQQSKLWPKGTLCITIAANIGETAILDLDACFPDSVVGLISNEKLLLNKYTNYFFISHKSKLEKLAPATAQKNINVDILEKVKIPLPSIKEQHLIVSELESKLTVCDKIEETISQSLQQAETLRQSILKQAFEGKLVTMKD